MPYLKEKKRKNIVYRLSYFDSLKREYHKACSIITIRKDMQTLENTQTIFEPTH
jgi:hypothetical protein